MKKYFKIVAFYCLGIVTLHAQVGMPGNKPNKDAVLDLNNTAGTNTKGVLLPKVALTATNSFAPLTAHTAGMHVYNTATAGTGTTAVSPGEYYNDGAKWIRIPSDAWIQDGNTNGAIKALGTNDAYDFAIKTNNVEKMRINSVGKVLVGTTTALSGGTSAVLQLNSTTAGAIQIKDGTEEDGYILKCDENGVGTWQLPGIFGNQGDAFMLNYSTPTAVVLTNQTIYNLSAFKAPKTGWYKVRSRMWFYQNNLSLLSGGAIWLEINTKSSGLDDPNYILQARTALAGNGAAVNAGNSAFVFMKAGTNYYIHYMGINAAHAPELTIYFTYIN